jgi:hypothetical protein
MVETAPAYVGNMNDFKGLCRFPIFCRVLCSKNFSKPRTPRPRKTSLSMVQPIEIERELYCRRSSFRFLGFAARAV